MKLFLDFFPIALFFIAFKLAGIYVATGVAMLATLVQIAWLYWRHHRVEPMQWVSLAIITLFGGATLLTHDETFIKWKPTVLYACMALALWGGWLLSGRNFIRQLMEKQMRMPDIAWQKLMHAWAIFFSSMAALNLWIAYQFDTETWVNFKLFGTLGLMVLFVLAQALYLSRHIQESE